MRFNRNWMRKCVYIVFVVGFISVIAELRWILSELSRKNCVSTRTIPFLNSREHSVIELESPFNTDTIEWNEIPKIRQKLSYFFDGQIEYSFDGINDTARWTVPVPSVPMDKMQRCFNNKWTMFYGDSRLRYSFAEWIRMINGSVEDLYFPHNSPCPTNWNYSECVLWFRGRGCGNPPCLRDWHPMSAGSGRWTFIATLTVGLTDLVTSSQHPDLVFINEGAWDIRDMMLRIGEGSEEDPYLSILEKGVKKIQFIDETLSKKGVIKIWMAYPECIQVNKPATAQLLGHSKKMNDLMEEYIRQRDDWIFFRLSTPNLSGVCEGFHVRDKWTKLENEIFVNALCD